MLKLAKLIFGGIVGKSSPHDALIDDAIEKAVEGSDPRLRAVPGYKRKLRNPVAVAVEFVLDRVARFPSALDMQPAVFGTDPQVRAFFGSADQMREVFSQNMGMRDFLSRPENNTLSHVYAALRMDLDRKRVLTHALRGDRVQSDVLRTAINFSSHLVALANATEKSLREDLEERVFMGLTECALESMTSVRERKSDLEEQRMLLKTKLGSLRASDLGMEAFTRAGAQPGLGLTELEHKLGDVETRLAEMAVRPATLEDHLGQLQDVFERPGDHIEIEQRSVRLTRMGFEPDPESPRETSDEISYMEIVLQGQIRAGALVRYAREDLLPERKLGDTPLL